MTDEIELYAEITRKNTRIQQLNAHLIVMAAAARTLLSVIEQDDPGDEWGRAVDNMRSVLLDFSTGAVGTPCSYAPRCVDEAWLGHEDHVMRQMYSDYLDHLAEME